MPLTYYVIHDEVPDPVALQQSGTATPAAISTTIDGAGSHSLSSLGVPAGKDVTLEIWSGGGGGGAGDTGSPAAGGGPGSYAAISIDAAIWALGGTIVLGAVGAAGTAAGDGGNAVASTVTIDSVLRATVGGGQGGGGDGGDPGEPGTTTISDTVVTLAVRAGTPGPAVSGTTVGSAGGKVGGPALGTGGAGGIGAGAGSAGVAPGGGGGGGSGTPSAGGAGAAPRLTYSFNA